MRAFWPGGPQFCIPAARLWSPYTAPRQATGLASAPSAVRVCPRSFRRPRPPAALQSDQVSLCGAGQGRQRAVGVAGGSGSVASWLAKLLGKGEAVEAPANGCNGCGTRRPRSLQVPCPAPRPGRLSRPPQPPSGARGPSKVGGWRQARPTLPRGSPEPRRPPALTSALQGRQPAPSRSPRPIKATPLRPAPVPQEAWRRLTGWPSC